MLLSNGGAFVFYEALLLLEADSALPPSQQRWGSVDLRAIIFDSAPVWPSPAIGAAALSSSFRGSAVQALAYAVALPLFTLLQPFGRPMHLFFHTLAASRLRAPELFIYSASDRITQCSKVEEHIAARRAAHPAGAQAVQAWRLEESPHCAHALTAPQEYEQRLRDFLGSCQ